MLDQLRHRDEFHRESAHEPTADRLDLEQLLAAVRRQWLAVFASIAIFLALAIAYIMTATPFYTATSQLLLDMNNVQLSNSFVDSTLTPSSDAAVTSQIQILKSQRMALLVIDRLNLLQNQSFMAPPQPGVLGKTVGFIRGLFPTSAVTTERTPEEVKQALLLYASTKLMSNLDAVRVDVTFVLRLSYSDPDPDFAKQVTQAYADAYLADQLGAKYETQRQAGVWLQQRIEELRQKSQQADLAVQKFRADNNLLATAGQLLSDQQLAGASTQLSDAEDALARSQSKYDQIVDLIKKGNVDAVVPDALQSSVITNLRNKYLEASKTRSDIIGRLGPKHEQVIRLNDSMSEFQKLIFQELGRIASSYKNEADVAKGKVELLKARLASASGVSAVDNTTLVHLRELQQESDAYRNLYQSFLQRLQQSVQQQSFPVSDARIVDNASVFPVPTSPRSNVIILLAIVLGGSVGGMIGGYREFRDRVYRVGDQVREGAGVKFFGYLPILAKKTIRLRTPAPTDEIRKTNAIFDYSIQQPFSAATEALRNVKVTVDHLDGHGGPRVIGILSVLPDEGKSTIAANLAELLAAGGTPTLLVDCDLRNPSLTKAMAAHRSTGLQNCLTGERSLEESILRNPETGLHMLPVGPGKSEIFGQFVTPDTMERFLRAVSGYKYVVLDLAPVAATVDARIIAPYVDAFVMVVEWGKTARRAVNSTLEHEPSIAQRCAGVILNKVNMRKMGRYQAFGSHEYYRKRIAAYYEHA